jgi:hypothetical protein
LETSHNFWTADDKLAMVGLYGFTQYISTMVGNDPDFDSIPNQLVADVYWLDLSELD